VVTSISKEQQLDTSLPFPAQRRSREPPRGADQAGFFEADPRGLPE
jgi:hypothetical protein